MFKFRHLIYFLFFFLLSCSEAAKEVSDLRVFSIDVSVTGLEDGENIQIVESHSGANKTVTANSHFTLPNYYLGDAFSIEVTVNPINKRCTVSNGTGLINGLSDNVNITCFRVFSVSANITGLESDNLVLKLNSEEGLSIDKKDNFTFSTTLVDGTPYTVIVLTQPSNPNQICTVTNGSGTISSADVANVAVNCVTVLYTIGGTITGLVGNGLVLQNNNENDLAISANDSFSFSTALADGSPYAISVKTQPSNPNQICTVTDGDSTLSGANAINVAVTCVDDSPPTASNVSITDDNSGNAVVGESLTGKYTYNDVNGDIEGVSTFRWLRNGETISGAVSSTYTLVAVDVPTQITFEVTPVAATGEITGNAAISTPLATGTAPVVSGFARYLDINMNSINDANDQLIIPFDQNINADAVNSTHFDLPVTGDTFGTGATVAAGPASNEVTITLGTSPNFKTRKDFSNAVTAANSASGIDVAALIEAGVIKSASGIDTVPSVPIDLIPAYVDSLQSLGAKNSRSVALGDVDSDGDLDMVVANAEANRVYINDGTGSFTDSVQVLGANDSSSVALGDVDSDGDLDMVVTNNGSAPNRVYTNDGKGNFTDSGQVLGANNSGSVALGDVDSDGDLDMVVANFAQANRVYINDGTGNFTDSGQALGANNSSSVALGDIDGDGDLDMVVANTTPRTQAANRVYINDGTGSFTSSQGLGANGSRSIALGDVDSDGDLDMVVANSAQANRVYINDSTGNFTDSGQTLGANNSSSVALGDIDGDGDLDMVVTNRSIKDGIAYINDGTGNFTDSGQALGANPSSSSIALGDVDGDGDLDTVVAKGFGNDVANRVYLNSLTGTWGTASLTDSTQALGANNSRSIALGDVDGDSDLDMVVANGLTQANRVYINDGIGSFADSGQVLGANSSSSIALGDVDGDGDLDMVVANESDQANRVYTNNGTGTFTDSGQALGTQSSTSVALGDLDDDGDLDMVVANRSSRVIRIYTNDGTGSFTDSGKALSTNDGGAHIALGDLDSDGDLDMVVANRSIQDSRAYINDGTGSFTDSGQSLGTDFSQSVVLGDLDSDGDLDMVVANDPGAARLYSKNGMGSFDSSQVLLGSNDSKSVALGDVDGDGDLDMVVDNRTYTNDGIGNFTDSGQSLGTRSSSIALRDLDGDGDLDMVLANFGANQVYLNQ